MFLYIARHAWAAERGDPRWPDDSLRELTPDGIERYTRMVKALAARGFSARPHRHQPLYPLPPDRGDHRPPRRRKTANRRTESPRTRLPTRTALGLVARTHAKRQRMLGRPQPRCRMARRRAHGRRYRPYPLRQRRRRRDWLRRKYQHRRRRTLLAGDGEVARSVVDSLRETEFIEPRFTDVPWLKQHTSTQSSSAAATTAWCVPLIWPRPAAKCACSNAATCWAAARRPRNFGPATKCRPPPTSSACFCRRSFAS